VDITAQLTDINLKSQGKNQLITQLYDDIHCFIQNKACGSHNCQSEHLFYFPKGQRAENTANNEAVASFANYDSHLE
jgi:hypothetical protein